MTDIFSEDKSGREAESRKRPSSGISGMIKRRNETRERSPLKETVTKSFGRISIYSKIPLACRFQLIQAQHFHFRLSARKSAKVEISNEFLEDRRNVRFILDLEECSAQHCAVTVCRREGGGKEGRSEVEKEVEWKARGVQVGVRFLFAHARERE